MYTYRIFACTLFDDSETNLISRRMKANSNVSKLYTQELPYSSDHFHSFHKQETTIPFYVQLNFYI